MSNATNRYALTSNGKEARKRYALTPQGKAVNAEAHKRYMQTARGKAARKRAMKKYLERYPWARTYQSIKSRCMPNAKYGKKGIKRMITVTQHKEIWIRDKAHLLKEPSIDRIDSKGHYEPSNCRYIELKLNSMLGRKGG